MDIEERTYHALIRLVPNSFLIGYFLYSGYKKKSLSFDGLVAGLIVALIHALCSQTFTLVLLAFYFSSSKLTKFKSDIKKKLEDQHQEGGNRNYIQVLSNSLPATLFSLLYFFTTGRNTTLINYQVDSYGSFLCIAVLAHYACCNGDTWASELGILSKSDPILITKLKRVPKGTNGGVSILGLGASFAGGLFIGIVYYISTLIFSSFFVEEVARIQVNNQFLPILITSSLAGLFGSILDSIIGATLQKSVWSEKKKVVLSDHNQSIISGEVKHISGKEILDNHQVNLISSFMTALIFGFIGAYIF